LIVVYAVIALLTVLAFTDEEKRRILTDQIPLKRRGMIGTGIGILGLIFLITWLSGRPDGRLHVAFLDIGQGDAILIQSPSGQQLLIDGGRYPSVVLDELGKQIPFWDRSIDMVLATHSDEDHIAGLVSVLERYKVSSLITGDAEAAGDPVFEALLAVAEEEGTPVHSAQTGEVIVLDEGVRLQILHAGIVNAEDSLNDASIVARLEYGDMSLLLTGDAEARTETYLLQTGQPLDSLILKAGHHGANTSSSQPFLTAVTPQIIVISVGRDNSYGHPSPAMLERAEAIGALVLRTDESGTLEVETDGRQMWWKAERQGPDDFLP
jgi:competence protein ComEC